MKQPNKEGSPSAEAVEGRPSPEGNGGKTAAARTLRRDTASNGLVAVRRAARQSKRGSFVIGRKTIKKRMRAKLKAIKVELRKPFENGSGPTVKVANGLIVRWGRLSWLRWLGLPVSRRSPQNCTVRDPRIYRV